MPTTKATLFICPLCRRKSVSLSSTPVAGGGVAERYQCQKVGCSFSCPSGDASATSAEGIACIRLYAVNAGRSGADLLRPARTAVQKAEDDAFVDAFEIEGA